MLYCNSTSAINNAQRTNKNSAQHKVNGPTGNGQASTQQRLTRQ